MSLKRSCRIFRNRARRGAVCRALGIERLEPRTLLTAGIVDIEATFQYGNLVPNATGGYRLGSVDMRGEAVVIYEYSASGSPVALNFGNPYYIPATGELDLSVSNMIDGQRAKNLTFVVSTMSDPDGPNGAYNVRNPAGGANAPYSVSKTFTGQIPDGTDAVTIYANPSTDYQTNGAFAVFDAITTGAMYAAQLQAASMSSLEVYYPSDRTTYSETAYVHGPGVSAPGIYVLQADAYDFDGVVHEYAHYFADRNGVLANVGEEHLINQNGRFHWFNGVSASKSLADQQTFNEGFADYFSVEASLATDASSLGIAFVGDGTYTQANVTLNAGVPTVTTAVTFSLDTQLVGQSLGEDNEVSVARILYQLHNGYTAPNGDVVKLDDAANNRLWAMIAQNKLQTLDKLWDTLSTLATFGQFFTYGSQERYEADLGALFQGNNVSAQPQAFGAGISFSGTNVPVFQWKAPVGVAMPGLTPQLEPLLNQFSLEFFNSSMAQIKGIPGIGANGFAPANTQAVSVNGVLTGGGFVVQTGGTVSWKPDPNQWNAMVAAGVAYWVVVGRDGALSTTPTSGATTIYNATTGDYWSGLQTITVAPAVNAGSAVEGNTGLIQITLAQPAPAAETIDYQATDDSAAWGASANYTFASANYPDGTPAVAGAPAQEGQIVIAAGQQEVDVTVNTVNQNSTDDKTFGFTAWLDGTSQPEIDAENGIFTILASQPSSGGSGSGGSGSGGGSGGSGDGSGEDAPDTIFVSAGGDIFANPPTTGGGMGSLYWYVWTNGPDPLPDNVGLYVSAGSLFSGDVSANASGEYSDNAPISVTGAISAPSEVPIQVTASFPFVYVAGVVEITPYDDGSGGDGSGTGGDGGGSGSGSGGSGGSGGGSGNDPNNPGTTFAITTLNPSTQYGQAPGVFQITRSGGDMSQPATVTPEIEGAPGSDDTLGSFIFPVNAPSITVSVTATQASTLEEDESSETVELAIDNGNGGGTGPDNISQATVTITIPPPPLITISGSATIDEAWGSTVLTVTRPDDDTSNSLTLTYEESGDAVNGQDYFYLFSDVTFLAGQSTAPIVVAAVDQGLVGGSETVTVSLDQGEGYQLGADSTASVTILNDDPVYATNGGPLATPTLDANATGALAVVDPASSINQGTLVSALLGSAAADGDGDATGIAVTAVDSAFGNWQYSLDGTSWYALDPVPADNGDAQAVLLPADSTTAVRFLANAGYDGTIDDAITFLAWDQAVGAPGTLFDTATGSAAAAFSAASATVPLSVDDPNAPPVVTVSGPGNIAAGGLATFTVTLSHASDQTVSVDWMPEDGTAVYPDDWTQGTVSGGYYVSVLDGYEVNAVQTGTLTDGYDYPIYSVDNGYYQTTYSNNDYSVDTGYYAGYDYNSYTTDEGGMVDGYEYNAYTTMQPVTVDGYYYNSYSVPNGSVQSGYTVTDLWVDEGSVDPTTGDWDPDIVDVPLATPYFTTVAPDPTLAVFYPDSQFVPDGTSTTVDGYWAPDASPDTSWAGGYVAQQGTVCEQVTVPSYWNSGPQDNSWPGGSYDDPQWVPDLVTVPGYWAPDVTPNTSWGGTYSYDPQWQDTGLVDVPAGTYTEDSPDPAWTGGYTTNATWVDTGTVSYGGYWEAGPVDPSWQGPTPTDDPQWMGSGASDVSVPFYSAGSSIDPSWTDYSPVYEQDWVPETVTQGGTLTFAPGQTQETVSIETIDDGLGGSKSFYVQLSNPVGDTLGDPSSDTATLMESGGGYYVNVLDGYEVYTVQDGTLTDGYDYPVYSVDNGYYQTTYSNNDYSVDTGYWQPGYQYNSYQQDTGYWQDGYDYAPYTTDGQVLTDGYYYEPYTPTTTVTGYTVTDVSVDQPYQDDSGDWIDNYVDEPVNPFFVATSTPDQSWVAYYPDSQQVPDGSPVDGYWAADATPDTSWPGGYVAQQGYVDGTITVPGTWAAGPQDTSWPGGSTDDPQWVDTGMVTVPGYWAADASPDPSWPGGSTYTPQWQDTGMVDVPAGTYTEDSPDPAWTGGYTTNSTWVDTGTVTYGGYWEAGPIDPSWQGPTPTDDPQWVGSGSSDVSVPFYSAGSSIDPSWTDYSPVYETDWVSYSAPVAGTVNASTTVGSTITIGLLSNSSDPQGWTLSVDSVDGGSLGTVANNGDGTVTYKADSAGTDSFGFTIDDGQNTASGTVVVTVSAAPLSGTDLHLACGQNSSIDGSVMAAISGGVGTIRFEPISGATGDGGSVTMDSTGWFSYAPAPDFTGTDSFAYSATDGAGDTATGTVYIVVS